MKKIAVLILSLCLALSLAACGGEANTPSPSGAQSAPPENTQTKLPASSEPEPSEPECEHDWTEANYQVPKTCTICGETEGDPLTPAFEENGLASNMVVGTTYDYKTICYNDPTKKVDAKATIVDYEIIESDEEHEPKEGYEWRIVTVHSEADGEDANTYGIQWREAFANYYSGNLIFVADEGLDAPFTVSYNGDEYECVLRYKEIQAEWVAGGVGGYTCKYSYEYAALVPAGYDGCVMVLYNAIHGSEEEFGLESVANAVSEISDEDTLFFRLA